MEVKTGIYKITSPSNKIYIGQSVNIEKRFKGYLKDKTKYNKQHRLSNSINKYGAEKHVFEIIELCPESELNVKERYWQDYYDVIGENGLNCRLTKTIDRSGRLSTETINKIIKANTGRIASEETKKLLSINNARPQLGKKGALSPNFGRKLSEEHKLKISKSSKGKVMSEISRERISKSRLGIIFSEDTKNKMRESSRSVKKIIDKNTGNIIFGIRQASKEIGIGVNILTDMLKGNRENTTNLIFLTNE
jgi:group I intron endonuclease